MLIYDFLIIFLIPAIFLILIIKYKKRKKIISDRFVLRKIFPKNKYIWIQAASIGEVKIANLISKKIRELYPVFKTILSTQTYEGIKSAKNFDYSVISPVDISFITRSFVKKTKPVIAVFLETEIWPNLIRSFRKKGVPVFLLNARISKKTFPLYKILSFLFPNLFKSFSLVIAKSLREKEKFLKLGVLNVKVSKNLKYDMVIEDFLSKKIHTKKDFNIEKKKVVIFGSMREKEEDFVIPLFKKLKNDFQDFIFIYVPRHIEYYTTIEAKLKKHSIDFSYWFDKNKDFVLVKKTGILFSLYAVSDIAVVGGGFFPYGGQNFLEAGVFSKPVIIGKYFSNFKEIVDDLKNELIIIKGDELYCKIRELLSDKEKSAKIGIELKNKIFSKRGAVEENLKAIFENVRKF